MIRLAGVDLVPHLSGALHAPEYDCLLVADLHFEKGSNFAARGQHLPPYDTRATLAGLKAALAAFSPRRLILLGDSFHDGDAESRIHADDMEMIRAMTSVHQVIWVTGNHDMELPRGLGGTVVDGLEMGPLRLVHIPSRPDGRAEIAGHLHPVAAITQRGRRLRRRCFVGNGERLVLPAFGAYAGGLNVLAEPFAPIFPRADFTAHMIGARGVHAFPAAKLSA